MNEIDISSFHVKPATRSGYRVENTPVYVLHRHPYSESSLILELFSREYGNLPVIAKGAKRPNSTLRAVLMLFQPLLITYSGKHEVRTLQRAEWIGTQSPLPAAALFSGYYLNELLLKLLPREDPHPFLFDAYRNCLHALTQGEPQALVLRRFEKVLLRELGYALHFDCDSSGAAIYPHNYYHIRHDQGAILAAPNAEEVWQGEVLLAIATEKFINPQILQQARNLMRSLLNRHLDGRRLKTRQILLDMQNYD